MNNNQQIYKQHISQISKFSAHCVSKYKISLLEIIILLLYPTVLLLGRLLRWTTDILADFFDFFFPFIANTDSSVVASHGIAAAGGNYYSSKHNLVNTYFVKKGWSWTIFAFTLIAIKKIVIDYRTKSSKKESINSRILITNAIVSVAKLLAATSWWWFFTQWFFGLPIMDRVFLATGGLCSPDSETITNGNSKIVSYISNNKKIQALLKKFELDSGAFLAPGPFIPESIPLSTTKTHDETQSNGKSNSIEDVFSTVFAKSVSSSACRRLGGSWIGGHDPSGHSFILAHSSLFLLFELIPLVPTFLNDLYLNNSLFRKFINSVFNDPEMAKSFCFVKQEDMDDNKKKPPLKLGKTHEWWIEVLLLVFNPLIFTSFILSLWAWMLFITGIYFHSLPELSAGVIVGYFEIVLVYIVPRFLH